jgi:1-aminocyclopropane-1-carboxylate deaminase
MYNELKGNLFDKAGVRFVVQREDAWHPIVGGNKTRKLYHNLIYYKQNSYESLLTFGGAFSNHIAAVAYTGFLHGIKTIGIIRGHELSHDNKNNTLQRALRHGMQLVFVDRSTYARRYLHSYHQELMRDFGNVYIIPEGGCNELGMQGCKEIINDIEVPYNYVACAVGTGTTLAGMASVLQKNKAIGINVTQYKMDVPVQSVLNFRLEDYCHLFNNAQPGYGKWSNTLSQFCNEFEHNFKIKIEPIYTGKMFEKLFQLIEQGWFNRGDTIVAVHTGGLQYLTSGCD